MNFSKIELISNSQMAKFNIGSDAYYWDGYYLNHDVIFKVFKDEDKVYYLFADGNYIPHEYAMTEAEAMESKAEIESTRSESNAKYDDLELPF